MGDGESFSCYRGDRGKLFRGGTFFSPSPPSPPGLVGKKLCLVPANDASFSSSLDSLSLPTLFSAVPPSLDPHGTPHGHMPNCHPLAIPLPLPIAPFLLSSAAALMNPSLLSLLYPPLRKEVFSHRRRRQRGLPSRRAEDGCCWRRCRLRGSPSPLRRRSNQRGIRQIDSKVFFSRAPSQMPMREREEERCLKGFLSYGPRRKWRKASGCHRLSPSRQGETIERAIV